MSKESYAGKINRKFAKKVHVVEVAAGREPEFCSLESVRRSMLLAFTEERSARCGRKLRVRA